MVECKEPSEKQSSECASSKFHSLDCGSVEIKLLDQFYAKMRDEMRFGQCSAQPEGTSFESQEPSISEQLLKSVDLRQLNIIAEIQPETHADEIHQRLDNSLRQINIEEHAASEIPRRTKKLEILQALFNVFNPNSIRKEPSRSQSVANLAKRNQVQQMQPAPSQESLEESKGHPSLLSSSFKLSSQSQLSQQGMKSQRSASDCSSVESGESSESLCYSQSSSSEVQSQQSMLVDSARDKSVSFHPQPSASGSFSQGSQPHLMNSATVPGTSRNNSSGELKPLSSARESSPQQQQQIQEPVICLKLEPIVEDHKEEELQFDEAEYYYVQEADLALEDSFDGLPQDYLSNGQDPHSDEDQDEEPDVPSEDSFNQLP